MMVCTERFLKSTIKYIRFVYITWLLNLDSYWLFRILLNRVIFFLTYQCQSLFNALSFHSQRRNDFLYCENADTHQKKIHDIPNTLGNFWQQSMMQKLKKMTIDFNFKMCNKWGRTKYNLMLQLILTLSIFSMLFLKFSILFV